MAFLKQLASAARTVAGNPPGLDQETLDALDFFDKKDKAREDYIRQRYAWGIATNPSYTARKDYMDRAASELTDERERQFLVSEVGRIAREAKQIEQQRMAESGVLGRTATALRGYGAAAGEAAIDITRSAGRLAEQSLFVRKAEDIKFTRALEGTRQQEFPDIGTGEDAPLTQRMLTGTARLAPDVAFGTAAYTYGGPAGATAYWAAREAPESVEDFAAAGLPEGQAKAAGLTRATAVGLFETVLPIPFVSKGLGGAAAKKAARVASREARKLLGRVGLGRAVRHPIARRVAGEAGEAAVRLGIEVGTEAAQEATRPLGLSIAAALSEDVEPQDLWNIPREAWTGGKEAMLAMPALMMGGSMVTTAGHIQRYRSKKKGKEVARKEAEVIRLAESGETPSRKEWSKLGLPTDQGLSAKQRREGVVELARRFQAVSRLQAVQEGVVPTAQQWKAWGFPEGQGDTADARELFVKQAREEVLRAAGLAEEARAPAGRPELSPWPEVAGREPPQPPPAAGVAEARKFAATLEGERPELAPASEVQEAIRIADSLLGAPESPQEAAPRAPGVPGVSEAVQPPEPPAPAYEGPGVADATQIDPVRSEVGQFFTDMAGSLGIPVDSLKSGMGAAAAGLTKLADVSSGKMRARGQLPEEVFGVKLKRDAKVARTQAEIKLTIRDYDRAMKQVYGTVFPPDAVVDQVDLVLRGEADYDTLPEPLRKPVADMRRHIDSLSQQLIDLGIVQDVLAARVAANIGVYLTRSYKAFDKGRKFGDLPEDDQKKVMDWFRKEYGKRSYRELTSDEKRRVNAYVKKEFDKTGFRYLDEAEQNKVIHQFRSEFRDRSDDELLGMIKAYLYEGKADESPMPLMRRSKLGAKDLSVLMRKRDLPEELRILLGEYKDPRLNYARSATKIAELIEQNKFLDEVKELGEIAGFFRKPEDGPMANTEFGDIKARIAAEGNLALAPLDGYWTTAEIKRAFEDAVKKDPKTLMQAYYWVNGLVKMSKTVFSPSTHARNFVGNTGFAVANGHLQFWKLWAAGKTALVPIGIPGFGGRNLVEILHGKGSEAAELWKERYLHLVELGILNQDVRSRELREVLKDATGRDPDLYFYGREAFNRLRTVKRTAKGAWDLFRNAYQFEDEIWKVYAFEHEMARYKKAYPDMSYEDLERKAASIVTDTYPTYSKVPEGIRKLRKFPLYGTFVSFPYEVYRTTYHSARIGLQDFREGVRTDNEALREAGSVRLGGLLISGGLGINALASGLRWLYGVTKDEDEAMDTFSADWAKNNTRLHLSGRRDDGTYLYLDMGYTDPHSCYTAALRAALKGENPIQAITLATRELLSPFTEEEILSEKIRQAMTNEDEKVYDKSDPGHQQVFDIMVHMWGAIEPGGITSMTRLGKGVTGYVEGSGKKYDTSDEALAFLGFRPLTLDTKVSLPYRVRDFRNELSKAERPVRRALTSKGTVGEDGVYEAFLESDQKRRTAYAGLSMLVDDAITLGMKPGEVYSTLKENGATKADLAAAMHGTYIPYRMTKAKAIKIHKANPDEYEARMRGFARAWQEIRESQPQPQ